MSDSITDEGLAKVFTCSNRSCDAIYTRDPSPLVGHCPKCRQPNGGGWSCMVRPICDDLLPPSPAQNQRHRISWRTKVAELAASPYPDDDVIKVPIRFGDIRAVRAALARLDQAAADLRAVGDDYPGSSCHKWCHERADAASGMEAPSGGETEGLDPKDDSPTAKPGRPTDTMTDIPIVERLMARRAFQYAPANAAPQTTWVGQATSVPPLINPDGPDAAALLKECVEALEGIKAALLETGMTTNGLGGVCWLLPDKAVRELNATLAAMTKGEE